MPNLLYREYKTGCYNYNNNGTLDRYEYGYGDSATASYYADLLPNTTYTLKKWDSSSRFRVALYTNDVKSLTGSGYDYSITQWWLSDNTDTIIFTTGSADIHLVVYYTNSSEYTTRIMLNVGSTAEAYEPPKKSLYPPEWEMEGDCPVPIQSLQMVTDGFIEPYPVSLWRIDENYGGIPYNDLMLDAVTDGFVKPYPTSLWRIDESNDGLPYNELMPDILYRDPIPPPEPDNQERANWLSHWFIRLGDIDINKKSVMGYISQKADRTFQPGNFKDSPHWNNSVQELNDIYYKMLGIDSVGGLIEWNYIEGGET